MGTVAFSLSMAKETASRAAWRCAEETAMITLDSDTGTSLQGKNSEFKK